MPTRSCTSSAAVYPAHVYTVFAVPVLVNVILLGMTLFIGAVSKLTWIEDEDREWWGRFGAWITIAIVGTAALAAITIFGPLLLLASPKLLAGLGGISGLLAVLLGKSALTNASGPSGAAPRSAEGAGLPYRLEHARHRLASFPGRVDRLSFAVDQRRARLSDRHVPPCASGRRTGHRHVARFASSCE